MTLHITWPHQQQFLPDELDPKFQALLPAALRLPSSNTMLEREQLQAFPTNSLLCYFNIIIGNIFVPTRDLKPKSCSLIIVKSLYWADGNSGGKDT